MSVSVSVLCVFLCHSQGHMVTRGTYSELQGSGLDFTSLLKEEEGQEEERQDPAPNSVIRCPHTLSDNSVSSMSSLSSSQYSLIDGTAVKYTPSCKFQDFKHQTYI